MFKVGDFVRITKMLKDAVDNNIGYPVETVGVVCDCDRSREEISYEVIPLHECLRFSSNRMSLILDLKGKDGFWYVKSELEKVKLDKMQVMLVRGDEEKTCFVYDRIHNCKVWDLKTH
nr:hypothetical protein [uncultured Lachnoclostridium sp.]